MLWSAAKRILMFCRKTDGQWRIQITSEVISVWMTLILMISALMYSLQLSPGNFPPTLTPREEKHYLELAAKGDMEARNVLIERNLRLVAHVMNKS